MTGDRRDGQAPERRAWGWVAALRDGATTPWSQWHDEADRSSRFLPGAQQLELLRRVNSVGRPGPALVERVVTASAPGRGRPDLELVGASTPTAWGPRPVDPSDLPADELLRVATSLLAEDVVAAGTPPERTPRLVRPWRPYAIGGVPWLAASVRDEMRRRGRRPGGRGFTAHVLGADPATMTELAFVARSFDEGGPSWSEWVAEAAGGRRPAPRADLLRMVRAWVDGVGPERVCLVLDHDRLPRLLGVRRGLPAPAVPSADATDLARRVAAPLGLLVLPDERVDLLRRTLLPRLLEHPGAPLRLDAEQRAWAHEQGERVRRVVDGAEYAVVGSTDRLLPRATASGVAEVGTGPDDDRVLDLAVRLLLDDERSGGQVEARR